MLFIYLYSNSSLDNIPIAYLYSNSSLDNIPVALITTSFWLKLSITTFMASSLDITNLNKKKISRQFSLFSYIKMNISYKFYLKDPYFTSHQFDQDKVHWSECIFILCLDVWMFVWMYGCIT